MKISVLTSRAHTHRHTPTPLVLLFWMAKKAVSQEAWKNMNNHIFGNTSLLIFAPRSFLGMSTTTAMTTKGDLNVLRAEAHFRVLASVLLSKLLFSRKTRSNVLMTNDLL